jgi:hypothetical protein
MVWTNVWFVDFCTIHLAIWKEPIYCQENNLYIVKNLENNLYIVKNLENNLYVSF